MAWRRTGSVILKERERPRLLRCRHINFEREDGSAARPLQGNLIGRPRPERHRVLTLTLFVERIHIRSGAHNRALITSKLALRAHGDSVL
jgi:hypothetical protein